MSEIGSLFRVTEKEETFVKAYQEKLRKKCEAIFACIPLKGNTQEN